MEREPLLRWWAYEYPPVKRSANAYISLLILAAAIVGAAILLNNILFAILIVIGVTLLLLFAIRRPRIVAFEITDRGIVVDKKLYLFKDLDAYWILDDTPPKLLLQSKGLLSPLISISLENVNPYAVKESLHHHIQEKELHEPLAQKLLEYLGW